MMYSGFLVAGALGLVGMVRAKQALNRRTSLESKTAGAVLILCVAALFLGGLALVGIFLSPPQNSDIPSRLITFVYLLWSPAFGMGIWFVRRARPMGLGNASLRRKWVLGSLCLGIILILPVASTWLLLPSYMHGDVKLDDVQVKTLSSWLRGSGDKNAFIVGDTIMTTATAGLARQPSTHGRIGFYPPIPDYDQLMAGMLYYGINMTDPRIPGLLGFQIHDLANRTVYLLVNKDYLSHNYYLITYYYEDKPPPKENDIAASSNELNAQPKLERFYCSSSVVLYASLHSP